MPYEERIPIDIPSVNLGPRGYSMWRIFPLNGSVHPSINQFVLQIAVHVSASVGVSFVLSPFVRLDEELPNSKSMPWPSEPNLYCGTHEKDILPTKMVAGSNFADEKSTSNRVRANTIACFLIWVLIEGKLIEPSHIHTSVKWATHLVHVPLIHWKTSGSSSKKSPVYIWVMSEWKTNSQFNGARCDVRTQHSEVLGVKKMLTAIDWQLAGR